MEKDFRYIIGRNIKAERLRKDITQEKFAELINMSLSYVSKVEQGLTSPTALVLYKISRVLEVKMEDFFKGITVEEYGRVLFQNDNFFTTSRYFCGGLGGCNKSQLPLRHRLYRLQ